uniref:F-box domain-containing protein n=1 Tax=Caenorhabditis japonica TaxID=281687 RepID=A0A8R1HTH2_CAEJA
MSARTPPRAAARQLTDMPESLLKAIFSNCSSVDMTRCSLVNRQFRELIEDMEDEKAESLRSCQKAKLFICDRRRAILEGVSTVTPTRLPRTPKHSESSDVGSSSASSIASTSSCSSLEADSNSSSKTKTKRMQTSRQKEQERNQRQRNISDRSKSSSTSTDSSDSKTTSFISDQYTDTNDPNWAFAFDFESWLQEYEINDIHFKNFCSFLEREKIDDPMSPSSYKGRTAYYESTWKNERFPPATFEESPIVTLKGADIAEVKLQSAGRIERLAERLSYIRRAHYTFKDSVCYGARPALTIFYFLELMRKNVRGVTFDNVQAATKVELHDVLSMANLQRLTVVQPENRPGVLVRANLFIRWMNLPDSERKRISVHLVGCREFAPREVFKMVQAWLSKPRPPIFKQIALDGNSYKYNDFVDILEALQNSVENLPPRSPVNRTFGPQPNQHTAALERTCRIAHPKDRNTMIVLQYCKISRRMVLTIQRDVTLQPTVQLKPMSPISTLTRLARPQSAAAVMSTPIRKVSSSLMKPPISPIPTACNNRQVTRPLSHDPMRMGCRENIGSNGSGMFNRLVSFLGTSS